MGRSLTNSDIETLQDFVDSGNRAGYYNQLSEWGYDYPELAGGVVSENTLSGRLANIHLAETAHRGSVTLNLSQSVQISENLMQADFALRSAPNSPSRSGQALSVDDIANYHYEVFENAGIDRNAWTATAPLEVYSRNYDALGFDTPLAAREAAWDLMINGGLSGQTSVYRDMQRFAFPTQNVWGVGGIPLPGDPLAQQWVQAVHGYIFDEGLYLFTGLGTPYPPDHCFLSDTPIQMWPLDPSIKPRRDGNYDEALVLSKVWEKPIREIRVGDLVVSYDEQGRIKPGPVTRTMENVATHILDFWGTGTTPGHAYYCADGRFQDQHVPILDILRSDGAIMRADGAMVRAATSCEVGSLGDRMIHASATLQKPDGSWTDPKAGKVRFGTRVILPDGQHMSFLEMAAREGWRVSDDGYMVGMLKGEDGQLRPQKFHFPYGYGEELPKPEDYILARSAVTLEEIYAAGEWEQIGTRLPAPSGMVGLSTNHTSTLLQPSKPLPNIPPAFANRPDAPMANAPRTVRPSMNRKQRKAMEAKNRKAAKIHKRVVN